MDKLTVTAGPGTTASSIVFTLQGPITVFDCFDLQYQLQEDQSQTTIIDMTGVPYVDSTGVALLVRGQTARDKTGRRMALVGVGKRARTILELTRVSQIFQMFDNVEAAEAAMKTNPAVVTAD
ncbi:MAG: STAS domain-containing protein [Acidobacteria bacterium]|nr:STAS domain-containing protein [Acidobacteriota bacterium]